MGLMGLMELMWLMELMGSMVLMRVMECCCSELSFSVVVQCCCAVLLRSAFVQCCCAVLAGGACAVLLCNAAVHCCRAVLWRSALGISRERFGTLGAPSGVRWGLLRFSGASLGAPFEFLWLPRVSLLNLRGAMWRSDLKIGGPRGPSGRPWGGTKQF
mgnify:CR=1 FL=1